MLALVERDVPKAPEQALRGWTNPPLAYARVWEADAYRGDVRHAPEIEQLHQAKRDRIGPVCGELFYFPGW